VSEQLDNCGCCEPAPEPSPIYNRPGLPALSYRVGTYGTFLRRMANKLARYTLPDGDHAGDRPLADLATRSTDDPSIALLDAAAVVSDVLTFYQERIANEGFLRTATERRSILEMAREIGYELNPGVAATAYLTFTVEDAEGAPGISNVPVGTQVMSIPPQGQLPQTFETSEEITARKEWNNIRLRTGNPQALSTSSDQVYLSGTSTNLQPGDYVLLVTGQSSGQQGLVRVQKVELDSDAGITHVTFVPSPSFPYIAASGTSLGVVDINQKITLNKTNVQTWILNKTWTDKNLNAFLKWNEWNIAELNDTVTELRSQNNGSTGSVFALRASAGFFGNNAPTRKSLPNAISPATNPNYGQDWDSGWQIWLNQQAGDTSTYHDSSVDAYLERSITGLVPDSWCVLRTANGTTAIYKIASAPEKSVAGFAMSGKVTSLKLKKLDGGSLANAEKSSSFTVRETTAYIKSEQLYLSQLPVTEDLTPGAALPLNGLVLGLVVGQSVTLSGDRTDMPGVTGKEILTIKTIQHFNGTTQITFNSGWKYTYKRSSVSLNANTVKATNGETVKETLGSGNGALTHQSFTLKKPPLTYTSASTPSGGDSSLELRVDSVLWEEASSLYGLTPRDEKYTVRIEDGGSVNILFGDGISGARLPTGEFNVTAVYRSGTGLAGQVDAGLLTLLKTRPLGVKSVTNPLAASGAADPEKMEDARTNAPLTVRTLDRIVSLQDYEDFARTFSGIGKAQAVALWSGEHQLVHLTIAGADGKPVDLTSDLYKNLVDAIHAVRDPAQMMRVEQFDSLLFNLKASLVIDTRYIAADVLSNAETALKEAFKFAKRAFGQSVSATEVVTILQGVEGVIAVDLDALHLTGTSEVLNQILASDIAHVDNGIIHRAQLLLVNTLGIKLLEGKP
jgi:hypothetical protein